MQTQCGNMFQNAVHLVPHLNLFCLCPHSLFPSPHVHLFSHCPHCSTIWSCDFSHSTGFFFHFHAVPLPPEHESTAVAAEEEKTGGWWWWRLPSKIVIQSPSFPPLDTPGSDPGTQQRGEVLGKLGVGMSPVLGQAWMV